VCALVVLVVFVVFVVFVVLVVLGLGEVLALPRLSLADPTAGVRPQENLGCLMTVAFSG
jgi:hypothetical protein